MSWFPGSRQKPGVWIRNAQRGFVMGGPCSELGCTVARDNPVFPRDHEKLTTHPWRPAQGPDGSIWPNRDPQSSEKHGDTKSSPCGPDVTYVFVWDQLPPRELPDVLVLRVDPTTLIALESPHIFSK